MHTAIENTPDGRRIVVSRPIDAAADPVWRVLTDTHRWPEWGPSVAAVECEDRFIEAGSRGHVRTVGPGTVLPGVRRGDGLRLPFRVTACDGRRWTWRVAGIPATGHRVENTRENCRAAFEIPPLAAAYAPICHRALAVVERLVLDDSG